MKPILIALVLLAGTFKSSASDGGSGEPAVLKSFKSTFTTAKEVDWSMAQDMYKAVFMLNGQYVTAYYNADGTMHALTRHVAAANLPVILQTELKNEYKGKWVSDVLEVTNEAGLQYYATLEDADSRVIVKSASTTWSLFQKHRKD